jgi:N-6 DNA Methylase
VGIDPRLCQCAAMPPQTTALDAYLDDARRIRATKAGTSETSYYPAIGAMLNTVGETLRPHVFCLHHPSGDSGIPDFGLFEQVQFKRDEAPAWTEAVNPERGVVEVKGASHSMATLLASKQIREKYLPAYGLVLATNLWQFRLLASTGAVIETFDIASDEAAFWKLSAASRPDTLRERFEAFITRCLLTKAPLRRPSDVAFFLASYAREALGRLSERAKLPGLAGLRKGMEDALGIRFDAKDGERLFRSTLVQTLFYGLFSAWVVHARAGKTGFDWRVSQWSLNVPVMRLLFGQIATPQALGPLDLVPLLDAAGMALERVERDVFFTAFSDEHAVQYFYEPFLEYYDPELRRQLGVWYTPPEIVHYQVERVDRLLRDQLGVVDGLANPDVWVLDPCCGTGSYIVAVLDRIRRTLDDRGMGDLAAEALKKAATTRVVGFEIMTAPFVISHWQVAERLHGAPLGENERASVYLTNALTGWSEGDAGPPIPGYEALVEERGAASSVKRDQPILVVIGNPPYYGYSGVSPREEGGLVDPYKAGLREKWGIRKSSLDDPYVRFVRIAERRITEKTGRGIVSYTPTPSESEKPPCESDRAGFDWPA